ncbi:hypothetical protein PM082_014000 [Marasmius tenuissimus]|nr:hypothetical protein PM082_014000 [Marasmius tenuissimus]
MVIGTCQCHDTLKKALSGFEANVPEPESARRSSSFHHRQCLDSIIAHSKEHRELRGFHTLSLARRTPLVNSRLRARQFYDDMKEKVHVRESRGGARLRVRAVYAHISIGDQIALREDLDMYENGFHDYPVLWVQLGRNRTTTFLRVHVPKT